MNLGKLLNVLPLILISYFSVVTPMKIHPRKLYFYNYYLSGDKKPDLITIHKKPINEKALENCWWCWDKEDYPIYYCLSGTYNKKKFKIFYDKRPDGFNSNEEQIGEGSFDEIGKIIYGRDE